MFGVKGSQFWMGYESSYQEARALEDRAAALNQMECRAAMLADSQAAAAAGTERLPRLYSRIENIGVISIKGSLVNAENWMTEWLNMATYPAIQAAAAFAANDKQVTSVILDINSGGGSVSGIESTVDILKQLKAVKPITTYSDGIMGSAAYWLGSVGKKIYVQATTIVGSIGTVMVHTDEAKALADAGLKQTIIRSGEFKMLGHPSEPLSDKAVAYFQAMVDKNSAIFEASVAELRGMSLPAVQKAAQGKEYLGADAQAAGLVDGVMSIADVISKMKPKTVANIALSNNNRSQQIRGSTMSRVVLTNEQMASAIAAGADEAALIAANAVATEALAADAAAAEAALTPEQRAEAAAKVVADAATAATATAAAAELAAAAAASAAVGDAANPLKIENDLLKAQLSALNATVVDLKVAAQSAETTSKASGASLDALRKIAADSINKMTVALGGSATTTEALSVEAVLARHAEVSTDFLAKFQVGGVAATKLDAVTAPAATNNVSSIENARIKAAKIGGTK